MKKYDTINKAEKVIKQYDKQANEILSKRQKIAGPLFCRWVNWILYNLESYRVLIK